MNRKQLENIYLSNGLKDFQLKSFDDLLKVHGINYTEVDGFKRLDDVNKQLYSKFILNIYNAWGLDSRATLTPRGIYFVEDIDYLVKENPDDDFFIVAGGIVRSIDKNGIRTVLHNWVHESYTGLEITEGKPKYYLRFEYEHHDRSEWLHVTGEKTWY